jgi:Xaa-Pro aminopeptidase
MLGIDVHDSGGFRRTKLEPGDVFTIEPGIYIPEGSNCDKKWWGIAIRIEDDILIDEEGNPVLLSGMAPRTVIDIEKLMAEPSPLDNFVLPDLDKK